MATTKQEDLLELGDFLDPILSVPFRGKRYNIPAVDADTAARIEQMIDAGEKIKNEQGVSEDDIELVNDESSEEFITSLVSEPVYKEMKEDKLPYVGQKMIVALVMTWTFGSFDDAKELWASGGKAPAPNREQRRTATRTRKDGANTTQKPASRNGTKPKSRASNGGKS